MKINSTPFSLLQALPYVCLLIAMLFFIYAIIGMQVSVEVYGLSFFLRALTISRLHSQVGYFITMNKGFSEHNLEINLKYKVIKFH